MLDLDMGLDNPILQNSYFRYFSSSDFIGFDFTSSGSGKRSSLYHPI
ncbi:MAG: hypothetical protein MJ069_06745 [Salinivirgaceae bacterium]|nr:hypothetical protein [Salinivirgaceae bacterium]